MKHFRLLTILTLFASGITAYGQVKPKPKPKVPAKPIMTQSATTDDGKRVVLKSDGTWEFDTQAVASAPKPIVEPDVLKGKFSPKVTAAAEAALKTIRRMASATEVGLTLAEYNTRLIDLKADVDEQLALIPEGELKTEIRLAVECYIDAQTAWSSMRRHDDLYPDLDPGKTLMQKYSIPVDTSIGMAILVGNTVRGTIWRAARAHVDKATQLLNQ